MLPNDADAIEQAIHFRADRESLWDMPLREVDVQAMAEEIEERLRAVSSVPPPDPSAQQIEQAAGELFRQFSGGGDVTTWGAFCMGNPLTAAKWRVKAVKILRAAVRVSNKEGTTNE